MSAVDIARLVSRVSGNSGGSDVTDHVPVDPLHDVERGADHGVVLAERDHVRHGDARALQGREHPVLASHVMRSREHVREWRASHHKTALTVIDDVREIGSPAGDHLATKCSGESADVRFQISRECLEVEPRRRGHC